MNAFALCINTDGKAVITTSTEFGGYHSGYFNPYKKLKTVEVIGDHFNKFLEKRYRKIPVYEKIKSK